MNKKLELELVKKYPIIFQDYGGDIRKTCMGWGIECGDGWFNIINQLGEDITNIIDGTKIEVVAQQVKEKFGGLRFYYYVHFEPAPISRLGHLIRTYMFSKKLGKEYWKIVEFRRKFFKTLQEKISDRIEKAERDSYKICETCGAPGKRTGGLWVKTSCDICDKKFDEGKLPWGDDWND